VLLEASTKPHVYRKFEIFWTNIASTMACLNFKNGQKNGLGPLGVNSTFVIMNELELICLITSLTHNFNTMDLVKFLEKN
jgi:hypothetical protein